MYQVGPDSLPKLLRSSVTLVLRSGHMPFPPILGRIGWTNPLCYWGGQVNFAEELRRGCGVGGQMSDSPFAS